ncbi:phospholipase effector Tle1 domain-containing protein [Mycolicibacterium pulveris]|uniref:phospholipase effector Tle1 domain-containing protein n=1 Tax=Mycolicibacterium pulveris TaxID=36813 RepID=UPI003CECC4B4
MKKLVLCFDRFSGDPAGPDATNLQCLLNLLVEGKEQLSWHQSGASAPHRLHRRAAAADDARAAVAQAYRFLVDCWEPGDRIFVFGSGRDAYCAQTLTRLLGTVGVLPDLMDYVLDAYAAPRTDRTAQDWQRVARVAAGLSSQHAVPVWFLGLWDTLKIPGFTRRTTPAPLRNVVHGRHAVAVDGLAGQRLVGSASERVEEVWFRGTHGDVTGEPGGCRSLAAITLDWMLDGALRAGLQVSARLRYAVPAPSECDAVAGGPHRLAMRKLPEGAAVHSSVDVYLREHPEYWRRLPARVTWADPEWLARGERLVSLDKLVS